MELPLVWQDIWTEIFALFLRYKSVDKLMKSSVISLAGASLIWLFTGCVTAPQLQVEAAPPPKMKFSKARQQLLECFKQGDDRVETEKVFNLTPSTLQMSRIFANGRRSDSPTFKLRDLNYVTASRADFGGWQTIRIESWEIYWYQTIPPEVPRKAAEALNALIYRAKGGDRVKRDADFAAFQTKAQAWRNMSTKPALSEDVTRHRVLAENAVSQKNFPEAVEHYERGVSADPFWAAGHFNAALIHGELEDYVEAVERARHYLELAPDSQDATVMKEKMIVWEDKTLR